MKDLIFAGAGNAAREILSYVKTLNQIEQRWNIKGFIADTGQDIEKLTNGDFRIIGTINDWIPAENEVFVAAIADPKGREYVVRKLQDRGAKFERIIHPTVAITDYSKIGEGVVMYPYASIGSNAQIGDFVFVLKTDIAHDCVIGEFSTISSLCGILGNVKIGKRVFVSCHSVILPGKTVGDDAFIGAGSIVIRNVKPGTKVFGNPAKVIDI
ncbi:MAG: NeuD/PglB/VioB family sugar acetyltransferase [Ignavibacteriales bacterium]|nr:NeuD/PglB/VioB family sugar acetyltransferase [Ignavibacteriales bacterium]